MNPLFRISPLALAITLAVLPEAQAADYTLTNGQETFSSDRVIDGSVNVRSTDGNTSSLTINNGATLTSEGGNIVGQASSTGVNPAQASVVVEGAGSRWIVPRTSFVLGNTIVVGGVGQGDLTVRNGGQVSVRDLDLGDVNGSRSNAFSNAQLLVSGQNSLVDAVNIEAGGVFVYRSGVTANDGGKISSQQVDIDSVVRLSDAGTRWDNSGVFRNRNDLTLENGAVLATDSLLLGSAISSRSNQVNVSGQGTRLETQSMTLGTSDTRTYLTLSDGAELSATNGILISTISSINTPTRGTLAVGGSVVTDPNRTDIDSVTAGAAQAAGRLNPQTAIRFGTGNGHLAFNHTDTDLQVANTLSGTGRVYAFNGNTTLSGDLTGLAGSVVVRGGRLVLSGDVDQVNQRGNTATTQSLSRLNVGNGTLVVNGTVGRNEFGVYTNSTQVLDGGVLAGTGQVGTTEVAAGGTLSPGESALGALTIQGDLDMAAGSRYAADIASNGGADRINVSGTATLRGTQVNVTALDSSQSYQSGRTYTLLSAQGGLVDGAAAGTTYAQAFTNSAFLNVGLQRTANDLNLTIEQKSTAPIPTPTPEPTPTPTPTPEPTPTPTPEPTPTPTPTPTPEPTPTPTPTPTPEPTLGIFQTVMLTENQFNTAGALSVLEQSGESLRLYNNLLILDAESARDAADQLSGDSLSSTSTALIANSQMVSGVVGTRVRNLLDSGSVRLPAMALSFMPGTPPSENGAWVQPFGNWTKVDGNKGADGLRQSTGGLLFGADGSFTPDWRGGVYGGYSRSKFDADKRDAEGHSDNYHLGLYTGGEIDALRLSADLGYTWHRLESERNVAFGGFSDRLTGKRDAQSLQANGEAAYRLPVGSVVLEPFVGLSYVRYDADDLHEKGGAAALDVSSDKQDTVFSTTGLRASTHTRVANLNTQVYGSLGWRRAYGDLDPRSEQSFAGGPNFEVQGVAQTRDMALTEVGTKLRLNSQTDLGLSYQGQFGSDTRFHSVNAGVTVRF
ncbi:autotransporter domain-containing protein [Pseudomonas fulva]|uniref:autotransporter outer membrane beta-barrel domain-containing protein n=1 Tax=Pseudomonas fulva TaxID=47880 RepID=UPI00201E3746|nr:autotransporter outer membrane beta-barrel domain-containing protein [Pseudomonas fulva]UQY34395.1 autotransporter domain-containing protein [Pseudomonas fulva]